MGRRVGVRHQGPPPPMRPSFPGAFHGTSSPGPSSPRLGRAIPEFVGPGPPPQPSAPPIAPAEGAGAGGGRRPPGGKRGGAGRPRSGGGEDLAYSRYFPRAS